MYKLRFSQHAEARLKERVGRNQDVKREIRRKLFATLRTGVRPEPDLAVYVDLDAGGQAVCYPDVAGGWVVVTILPAAGADGEGKKEETA